MDDDFFRSRCLNSDALKGYGFQKKNGLYTRTTELLGGQFQLTVFITADGEVKTGVIDQASGEEYVLFRVANAVGSFVGKVREACENELAGIAEHCFEPDVFKSECAKQVIRYVRETCHDELEFLWKRFPENAVFRRSDNKKWYAALLTVSARKLGLNDDSRIEIIDLRIAPEESAVLLDDVKYFPGYHMNKQHWFTIKLDGSVPLDEIFRRLDTSYDLAAK